jgi:hypothetical protein
MEPKRSFPVRQVMVTAPGAKMVNGRYVASIGPGKSAYRLTSGRRTPTRLRNEGRACGCRPFLLAHGMRAIYGRPPDAEAELSRGSAHSPILDCFAAASAARRSLSVASADRRARPWPSSHADRLVSPR